MEDIPESPKSTPAEKRDIKIMQETLKTNPPAKEEKEKIDPTALLDALGKNRRPGGGNPEKRDKPHTEASEKP